MGDMDPPKESSSPADDASMIQMDDTNGIVPCHGQQQVSIRNVVLEGSTNNLHVDGFWLYVLFPETSSLSSETVHYVWGQYPIVTEVAALNTSAVIVLRSCGPVAGREARKDITRAEVFGGSPQSRR